MDGCDQPIWSDTEPLSGWGPCPVPRIPDGTGGCLWSSPSSLSIFHASLSFTRNVPYGPVPLYGNWLCPTRREKKKTKLRVQSNPIVQLLVHDAVSDCPTSCCGQSHRSIRRKTSVYPSVPMPCHALRSRTGTRGSVGRSISSGQG